MKYMVYLTKSSEPISKCLEGQTMYLGLYDGEDVGMLYSILANPELRVICEIVPEE